MLRAAIFDLDGLLIDSEPLWRRTEVEVFAEVGLALTEEMCRATTGLRIDEVARHWYARAPWEGPSCDEVAARIVDRMIERVRAEGSAMPGAERAIDACARAGLRLAIASSSPERLIAATVERLGLAHRFELLVSAERERFGKPHPAVFVSAMDRLGVDASECVIFEDSLHGVLAAKAARAACVAVPAAHDRGDARFAIADRVLGSLEEVDGALLASLARPAPRVRHVLTILAADDIEPLVAFYREAFGWPITVRTPAYVELEIEPGRRLGIYRREGFGRNVGHVPFRVPEGELAPVELYLDAPDLDGAVARLERIGARSLSPRAPRPWGDEAAYFADPEGNVVVVSRPIAR
ncbi:MAG TPA: hexitol phosphatase HxpB [Sandaracinaceae bacterium]